MFSLIFIFFLGATGCDDTTSDDMEQDQVFADVTAVKASGPTGKYTFQVTISSPDTGCDQYADWWEVVTESGELVYRRILGHSHVNEQPFTRQGGTVLVEEDDNVWIRAHMNNSGYGGRSLYGSAEGGFMEMDVPEGFGENLENELPQPTGCAF